LNRLSLDNRVFVAIANSEHGIVSSDTRFHFWQQGDMFFADYSGGDVREGHIIGQFTDETTGTMLYHCMTKDHALKAGEAKAQFAEVTGGRLTMDLNWRWLTGDQSAGTSHYEEISS